MADNNTEETDVIKLTRIDRLNNGTVTHTVTDVETIVSQLQYEGESELCENTRVDSTEDDHKVPDDQEESSVPLLNSQDVPPPPTYSEAWMYPKATPPPVYSNEVSPLQPVYPSQELERDVIDSQPGKITEVCNLPHGTMTVLSPAERPNHYFYLSLVIALCCNICFGALALGCSIMSIIAWGKGNSKAAALGGKLAFVISMAGCMVSLCILMKLRQDYQQAVCLGKATTNKMSMKEEIRNHQFWKAVRCEFLVTLLYVFTGCGALTAWPGVSPPTDVKIALAFGLACATLVQCVGHISGAHLNPAVTMAMLVTRNITPLRAFFYTISQIIGGIAGAGILYGVTPSTTHSDLGVTRVHSHLGLGQAFGMEFMITFLVVFTVFANLEPKRIDMGSRSLAIGLSVCLGHLVAFNYTGASMNPARSLGPAIVMNIWDNHWVYWVGPMLGGIIGGFTYEYTHDSSGQLQTIRRSFRRHKSASQLKRSRSTISNNSTMSTEMTFTPTSEDMRI